MLSLVTTSTIPCQPASPSPALLPVACNPALERLAQARRVLLLQGSVGPFFDRLTHWLHSRGTTVHRVVFHAGDRRDCRAIEPIAFRGRLDDWPGVFADLLEAHQIDCVALFGQARPHHACALAMARPAGLPVVVFEEGYVRPGFATMELGGVNGHSTTLDRYRWCSGTDGEEPVWPSADAPGGLQWRMALHAVRHYLALCALPALNPHHVHHRSTRMRHHVAHWLRTTWRWWRHHHHDALVVTRLANERYFFFPLQNEGDAQITEHSPFRSVQQSVARVLESFARHAPAEARLVVRQHPWSRGHRETERAVLSVAERLGIRQRVVHLHEGDTAALVRHAAGVVVVNSTVGLLALHERRPLMALGDAVYRRNGLCHTDDLDHFWRAPREPAAPLVHRFLRQLIGLTQVPCDLYASRRAPLGWRINPARMPCGSVVSR